MYYEDLTPYSYAVNSGPDSRFYLHQELRNTFGVEPEELRLLNFGWLDLQYPFARGDILLEEVDKIATLCRSYKHMMRGYHACHFCVRRKSLQGEDGYSRTILEYKSQEIAHGAAEVWIKGNSNIVYMAPNLVLHYIMEHRYQMPDEVKQALKEMGDFSFKSITYVAR